MMISAAVVCSVDECNRNNDHSTMSLLRMEKCAVVNSFMPKCLFKMRLVFNTSCSVFIFSSENCLISEYINLV